MSPKFRYAALAFAIAAAPLCAHDFWIQPLRFQVAAGAPVPANFLLGHAAARQRWGLGADHVLLMVDVGAGTRRDIRGNLKAVGGDADLVTQFATPGLHVLAMQTTYALSDLPALRFNDYAKAEGLTPILAIRNRSGTTSANGRERYSRRAKALIQVGNPASGNQSLATRAIGLKLEIVPERNPYALDASRMLPVRVMYNGRRLPGATVKLTSLEFDAKPLATAITDRNGHASLRVPPVGDWLVNVIWSEPVKGDPKVDFDTTFSSLTFGYNPARRGR